MLEHEAPQTQTSPPPVVTQPTVTPAAERRVSPEELTAALNALDASRQQAAQHLAGTVPIGQVVTEMGLDATPEEIWAQVQRQRAQKADDEKAAEDAKQIPFEQAAKQTYQQRPPTVAPVLPTLPTLPRPSRPMLRRVSQLKGWVWILFWCTGGFGLLSAFPHLSHPQTLAVSAVGSGQTLTINGDLGMTTVNAQGKDVVINGDFDRVTLIGTARSVTVNGDFDKATGDTPQTSTVIGDFDSVQ